MTDDIVAMLMGQMDHEHEKREKYLRAPFGWPGGKDLSKEHVLKRLPYRNAYIEHCGGSGIVWLNRQPSTLDVFNDRDAGVVAFYRVLRNPATLQALIDRLELVPHSREEFLWSKETWKSPVLDDVERAARWYYTVRFSFTQQMRNFGRQTSGDYTNSITNKIQHQLPYFKEIHKRVVRSQIENLDLFQSIADFDNANAVHYIDPPYIGASQGIYEHELTMEQHAVLCERIMNGKGFFALSGYPNELYDSYKWDDVITWEVPVTAKAQAFTIANNKEGLENYGGRKSATECLWIRDNV